MSNEETAIAAIRRAWDRFGSFVLVSELVLRAYRTKEHQHTCVFKKGYLQSFTPDRVREEPLRA